MKAITAVKPGDGFDHWHHVTCRQFSVTQCRSVVDRNFRARISIREFGALGIHRYMSSTPPDDLITVTRRPADIRKDHRDNFQLWLMLTGHTTLAQQDRTSRVEAGDLLLQDQSLPFDLELGHLAHALMVEIPRPLLSSRISTTNGLAAVRVPGDSGVGALVASVVHQLSVLDETTDERVEGRLVAATLEILSAALEAETGTGTASTRRRRQLDDVKRYMRGNLHDTELDLATIAKGCNVAPRTLNRLFAQEGTTPMRWLWQQRLAASYRSLSEGRATKVTNAALDFGFKDLSHFSRTFKAAYGRSPRSLVRRASR